MSYARFALSSPKIIGPKKFARRERIFAQFARRISLMLQIVAPAIRGTRSTGQEWAQRYGDFAVRWFLSLSIRRRVQWGVTTLLLFIVSTLAGEWIIAYATERGLFSDPVNRADAVAGWLGKIIGQTASVAVLSGLAGLAAGMWLDAFLAALDRRSPKPAPQPDITADDLIARIMKSRGIHDDGSLETLQKIREIGREVGDQMSLRKLTVWARVGGSTLKLLPYELSAKGLGIGRNASKQLNICLQYRDEADEAVWLTDYRFAQSEVGEIWSDD